MAIKIGEQGTTEGFRCLACVTVSKSSSRFREHEGSRAYAMKSARSHLNNENNRLYPTVFINI